jgi:hypothetical protein
MNQTRQEWKEEMIRQIILLNFGRGILRRSHEKVWGLNRGGRKEGNGWEEKQCPIVTGKIEKWDGKWQSSQMKGNEEINLRESDNSMGVLE